jgi:SPP1 family predicted phage head-tail adaptor
MDRSRRNAGRLDQRLQIQRRSWPRDTFGGGTLSWRTLDTRWAAIEPLDGGEVIYAGGVVAQASHRVELRYYPGLSPEYRFVHSVSGQVYEIQQVRDLEQRKQWHVCDVVAIWPTAGWILQETGDRLLQETGDLLLVE